MGEIQSGFSLPEGSKVTKGLSHTDMCVWLAWEYTLVFGVLCAGGDVGMMRESLRTGNSLQTPDIFPTKPNRSAPVLTPKHWSATYWGRQKLQPL